MAGATADAWRTGVLTRTAQDAALGEAATMRTHALATAEAEGEAQIDQTVAENTERDAGALAKAGGSAGGGSAGDLVFGFQRYSTNNKRGQEPIWQIRQVAGIL